jgi:hypothetical protein
VSDDRHVGGDEWPHTWDDDDLPDPVDDDPNPENWPDVEWSTEQTFVGEFGYFTAFGDPID